MFVLRSCTFLVICFTIFLFNAKVFTIFCLFIYVVNLLILFIFGVGGFFIIGGIHKYLIYWFSIYSIYKYYEYFSRCSYSIVYQN